MAVRQPKPTRKSFDSVQLSLPLDVDELASLVGSGIDVDPDLPHLDGYRVGNLVVLRGGLSRADERMVAAHELGHVAGDSADIQELAHCNREVLDIDERRADEFRNQAIAPRHVLFDRLGEGATQEELCWEFGVTPMQLLRIVRQHETEMRRGFL